MHSTSLSTHLTQKASYASIVLLQAKCFTCVQAEADCRALGVALLTGPGPNARKTQPLQFAEELVSIATNPVQNIAKTPALMLQRQQAEDRMRRAKYALLCAAVVAGAVLVYSVATSSDSKHEGAARKEIKRSSHDQAPQVRSTPQGGQSSIQWRWPWQQ
jgi:tellurite resistance-related uncharacterized protein